MNHYHIDIQQATDKQLPVTEGVLSAWASLALRDHINHAELTIRLVDENEMTYLNRTYRNQDKPTNVLAFPSDLPETLELEVPLLGDIVICPQVLEEESKKLGTPLLQHWAHIVIHGVLHLLGYDHLLENEAVKMQAIEINLLDELGYDNPYGSESGKDEH